VGKGVVGGDYVGVGGKKFAGPEEDKPATKCLVAGLLRISQANLITTVAKTR
jgi:hypothetical protein